MLVEHNPTFNSLVRHIIPPMNLDLKNVDFFSHGLRNILLQHEPNRKHTAIYRYLRYDISFIPIEKREGIFHIFSVIQKHYLALSRFCNICRFKLLKNKIDNQYDLFFNDLNDCPNNLKVTLYEQTRLYTFKIFDILHIIKSSLVNYQELFLVPSLPKNPYTNLAFSYSNMYNIFYHCQYHHIAIPKVFRYFYYSDFQLDKFIRDYEPIVRETVILSYFNNMTFNQKYDTILDIVNYYKPVLPIIIHNQYPKKKVITFLEHAIVPYLRSLYSLNQAIKDLNKVTVFTILTSLHKNFGRVEFDTKTCSYIPCDQPKSYIDTSASSFGFNTGSLSNDVFIFGSDQTNNNNNINNNDMDNDMDMDIDSDSDDMDIDYPIIIPSQDVVTYNSILLTNDPSNNYMFNPIVNPVVRQRNLNTITDISFTTNTTPTQIINARTRLREMLAGND